MDLRNQDTHEMGMDNHQTMNDAEEFHDIENYNSSQQGYELQVDANDTINSRIHPIEDDQYISQNTKQLKLQLIELEKQYEIFKKQFLTNVTQVAENIIQSWDERFLAHVNNIQSSIETSKDYMLTLLERKKEKEHLQQWINKLLNRLNCPDDNE